MRSNKFFIIIPVIVSDTHNRIIDIPLNIGDGLPRSSASSCLKRLNLELFSKCRCKKGTLAAKNSAASRNGTVGITGNKAPIIASSRKNIQSKAAAICFILISQAGGGNNSKTGGGEKKFHAAALFI